MLAARRNGGPGARRTAAGCCRQAVRLTALLPPCRRLATASPDYGSIANQRGARPRRPPLTQEAVMGQPIPAQHPSVVLRSHFNLVRTLLILAVAALLASSAAVVILANDEDQVNSAAVSKSAPAAQQQLPAGTRFDGGPDEGTRGLAAQPTEPRRRRASTVAPKRAPAAPGRTTSRPISGPAISRLRPTASRIAPVARG